MPPAAWPDSPPSSSSPAGIRTPEASGKGRRQTGDGKCSVGRGAAGGPDSAERPRGEPGRRGFVAPVLLVRPWPSACGTVTFQRGQGSGATALLPRPQPDARVQAPPHRHGRPQPGPGLDAQAAPLCVYYAPCSVCFFTKTLTVRAVSHCLKITSLHPHALAGINLVLTCGSSAFQKANKSRGDRDLRIPFVPFLVPGGPGAGSAPKPFGCSRLPGDVSSSRRPGSRFQNPPPLHGKHPWDFRHKSRTRRRPVCDTLLSPEALGGPQPGSGGWGSASAVPVAPRALPRQGPVGRIQPRC